MPGLHIWGRQSSEIYFFAFSIPQFGRKLGMGQSPRKDLSYTISILPA
jgi:hypothetical protein